MKAQRHRTMRGFRGESPNSFRFKEHRIHAFDLDLDFMRGRFRGGHFPL
jgi:hypothetical protein